MKKRIKQIIALIILLPVIGVAAALYWIDAIAKAGVEHGATYALGVRTTLDSMSVGVIRGRVALGGLDVANPAGFKADRFMRLNQGRVGVSLGSLREDTVVLPELRLTGLDVNLERGKDKGNYEVILDGLKKFENADAKSPPQQKPGKKFVIRLVTVEDVDVQVDVAALGGSLGKVGLSGPATSLPLHFDKIELRDIGSETDGGMLLSQLSGLLTRAILEAIVKQGGSVIPDIITGELSRGLNSLGGLGEVSIQVVGDVTTMIDGQVKNVTGLGGQILDGAGKTVEGLGKGAGEVGKGVTDVLGKTGEAVGEGVGKIGEGLGGLLGGKKEKEPEPDDKETDDEKP